MNIIKLAALLALLSTQIAEANMFISHGSNIMDSTTVIESHGHVWVNGPGNYHGHGHSDGLGNFYYND